MKTLLQQLPKEITDKYSVENNTLKQEVKSNPKDRISLEIGDSKQPDFKPQVKIMRWDNEINFSIRAQEDPNAIVEIDKEKIKYIADKYEIHLYDKPDTSEDGGVELEWVLKEKPASNILTATIQTKGLNFFYQPLTQEEINDGTLRPENVEGSYAVYHATKGGMNDVAGMEYKTGKAFHIYRPKVIDANGVETWGDLNIDEQNGLLTVTIDQTWLETALYPVIVDPTFGYTSIGVSTSATIGSGVVVACQATSIEAGDITSMTAHRKVLSGTADEGMAIYSDSSAVPDSKIAEDSGNVTVDTTYGWDTVNISASIVATDYHLATWVNGDSNYKYDAGASGQQSSKSLQTFETWPNPFSRSGNLARIVSIYATYTAAGAAAAIVGWRNLLGVGL